MDKAVIDKLEQLVKDRYLVEVGGKTFTAANLNPVIFNPLAETISVHTLSGFCDFISHNIDGQNIEQKHIVHVIDHKNVEIFSPLKGEDFKRDVLIQAQIDEHFETFPFGKFLSQEEFAIRFRSMFEVQKGDDTEYVLSFVSKLTGGTSITSDDDGITQEVGVKRGVSGTLKGTEKARAIVFLAPYRTFREITQPRSEFLLRIRLNDNEAPTVALFEADGGRWINEAIQLVAEYIKSRLPNTKIIA